MNFEISKPVGAESGWHAQKTRVVFQNKICKLREDEVELPKGGAMRYAYLERAEAVVIVAITKAREIVLVKQYRYPVDEWCLEVPAGGTHDSGAAELEEVVRKELREETGATCDTINYVDFFYSASAFTDEKCQVFLAEGVVLTKKPRREASESISLQLVPVAEAIKLARSGAMRTASCALALLLAEPLLKKKGYLTSNGWLYGKQGA